VDQVRRRRECLDCTRRFTTYEKLAESEINVAKRGGRVEPFDRDKLQRVVERVARGRRHGKDALRNLVRGLEAELIDVGARTVSSAHVGERLLERLRALDAVVADRFASNYRQEDGSVRISDEVPSPQLDLLAGVAGDAAAPAADAAPIKRGRGRPRKAAGG
jgi:transcriptional repressor NrdR